MDDHSSYLDLRYPLIDPADSCGLVRTREPCAMIRSMSMQSSLSAFAERAPDVLRFIDASPSPYHVVTTVLERLQAAGFVQLPRDEHWTESPGRWCVVEGATVIAWVEPGNEADAPFTVIGAHTDSPNLRIKPLPDTGTAGFRQLGVEVYGGVLLNSWLDRDLGISGRVDLRDGATLLRIDEPVLRIPQLAIHLDREISDRGLSLNRQQHMRPVWGTGAVTAGDFRALVAEHLNTSPDDVLAWDLMTHDLTPSTVCGADRSMIAAPRLDNQMSCWAATEALIAAADAERRTLICLFDHEEVGSESATGAGSALLPSVVERIVALSGGGRDDLHVALARSFCVSADGAHATHPNYAERHDPEHQIALNGGPVIKINANERYATNAHSHARFIHACEAAGVPYQRFVSRSDMPCGSTIGPVTSAKLGILTVDAGVAQLAMHSARETAGAADPAMFANALATLARM